jgi:4-hydroxy-tetrahydrodipicolinate synthase
MADRRKLSGIVPPIGTPLTPDERVDEKGMRRLVDHLLKHGVNAIFANGGMGAFALLSDQEQARAVEIVIDEVNGRVPVMAGAADTSSKRVIEKAKRMATLGADYISILPPYYFPLTAESVTKFYLDVAEAIPHPIFIYNNPYTTNYRIPLESIFQLGEVPNIVGLKESDQDCERWQSLTHHFKSDPDFSVLIGTEGLIKVALQMGADGVVSGLHNVAPQLAVDLYREMQSGNLEEAVLLQQKLIHLFGIFTCGGGIWGPFEVALNFLGICEKVTASPYDSPVEQPVREKVEAILRATL